MVRQKEIAEAAGVSIMTVSRALRNQADLAPETRDLVLRTASELGYTTVSAATGSRKAMPRRVGVFVYQSEAESYRMDIGVPHRIFLALQSECKKWGVEVLIETVRPNEVPLLVRKRTIDRAFLFGRYGPEIPAGLQNLSVLAVSNYLPSEHLPRLIADNEGGIQALTQYLLGLGHRKILFLGGTEEKMSELFHARERGYRAAMTAAGLPAAIQLLPNEEQLQLETWFDQLKGITAVVCATDMLAFSLDAALRLKGWDLPRQCSITGFDNLSLHQYDYMTTYEPDWTLMGKLATTTLLFQMEQLAGKGVKIIVPGRMILRKSTQALADLT